MNKKFDIRKITVLIDFYNDLVDKYDIPAGAIQIQLDDNYVGEVYAIDFEYNNGTFIISIDDNSLYYSYVYNDDEGHGNMANHDMKEIAEIIKKVIK